ncbi:antitoxin [Tessaracoccus lacteus]|uniref:Antitoxin n=1 Tax=Tessaracoccus lacteus TaxID=3041766 RepID=A0ABY8PUT0_9ACTN|nr:antitoxin [Tessaracoccus sp. T21]WGT46193.1 antitoxin [Tessaracoccus sp. T21]
MGIFDKIGDLAKQHEDKIEEGIEKTGDFVDEKTGGKYAERVDQAQQAAKDQLDKLTGDKP